MVSDLTSLEAETEAEDVVAEVLAEEVEMAKEETSREVEEGVSTKVMKLMVRKEVMNMKMMAVKIMDIEAATEEEAHIEVLQGEAEVAQDSEVEVGLVVDVEEVIQMNTTTRSRTSQPMNKIKKVRTKCSPKNKLTSLRQKLSRTKTN